MLALYARLVNLLPEFGLAQTRADGSVGLQNISDLRGLNLLRRRLRGERDELLVLVEPSRFLSSALARVLPAPHTFVSPKTVLRALPKDLHYVSEGFEGPCLAALRLLYTHCDIAGRAVRFQSTLDADFTTVSAGTLRALNVLPNKLQSGSLLDHCSKPVSAMGKRRARAFLLFHPLTNAQFIAARQQLAGCRNAAQSFAVLNLLRQLPDLDKLNMRLCSVALMDRERQLQLRGVIHNLWRALSTLHAFFEHAKLDANNYFFAHLRAAGEGCHKWMNLVADVVNLDSFDRDAALPFLNPQGRNPALQTLYAETAQCAERIRQELERLHESDRSARVTLKSSPQGEQLLRLPRSAKLPRDARIVKLNKAEVLFMTDRFAELLRAQTALRLQAAEIEKDVVEQLFRVSLQFLPVFERVADLVGQIDAFNGWAEALKLLPNADHTWVAPRIVAPLRVHFRRGRHPLLALLHDLSVSATPCVPNDFRLDDELRHYLITGANMGGKSTYNRQQMLLVLLAQYGMRVPTAADAETCVFHVFWTRIGGADNPSRGVSTFLAEAAECAAMIHALEPGKRHLLLIDELGRGTSIEDGLLFAKSILQHLISLPDVCTVSATHMHELTTAPLPRTALKRMSDPNDETQRYRLLDGVEYESSVRALAQRLGFPLSIVDAVEAQLAN